VTEEQRYFNSPEHWREITEAIRRFTMAATCMHPGCKEPREANLDYCRGHEGGFTAPFVGRTEQAKTQAQTRIEARVIELAPMIQLKVDGDVWELAFPDAHRVAIALLSVIGYEDLSKLTYPPKKKP
jgi:hypothetical protein